MNTLLLSMATLLVAAAAARAEPVADGVWQRGDGNARVRIAACGNDLCATNIWIKDTSGGEAVGDRLVMNVEPSGSNTLDGKAFDPKRNLTYAIKIKVGQAALTTRGCVLGGVLCKSMNWTRVGAN